jgi:LAO/AO transport system kinase
MTSIRSLDAETLYRRAREGDRRALGRLLTLVERGGATADQVTELSYHDVGRAHVVGITGAPGAGKSTLTGQLVALIETSGRRPAVLAVDPSSPLTGGAILGDRVRMDDVCEDVFIRSMATRGHSGGLALAVPAAVRLLDAVGYDPVIIETVGVGQVEVDVAGTADTTVVVVNPGWGDAVQANKAGLLELADVFVVNKADRPGADGARRDLELMLDLGVSTGRFTEMALRPSVVMTTATDGQGADVLWEAILAHHGAMGEVGGRELRRASRVRQEITNRLEQLLREEIEKTLDSPAGAEILDEAVLAKYSPPAAARALRTLIGDADADPT